MDLAFAYVRPGDQLRRMCGYDQAKQPDVYATDYSDIIWTQGAMQQFCDLMGGSNCQGISDAASARPFFDSLNTKYSDMTGFPNGLTSFSQSVCIPAVADCKFSAAANYVCHREFKDLADAFTTKYGGNLPFASFPFITEAELSDVHAEFVS